MNVATTPRHVTTPTYSSQRERERERERERKRERERDFKFRSEDLISPYLLSVAAARVQTSVR